MNHQQITGQINAALDGAVKAGGSIEEIATRCMVAIDALPFTDDEIVDHCLFDLTESATGTKPTRLQATQKYFTWNQDLLSAAIVEEHPTISRADTDHLLARLYDHNGAYRGSSTEGEYLAWATRYIRREADVLKRFGVVYANDRKIVLKALWLVLMTCTDLIDDSTVDEIESLVWESLLSDPNSPLRKPGTAKLTTRLHGMAYAEAKGWKTKKLRAHAKHVTWDNQPVGAWYAESTKRPAAI